MFTPAHCFISFLLKKGKKFKTHSSFFFFPLHAFSITSVVSSTLWPHGLQPARIHGILQARTLERVAMPSSRGSSPMRDWIHVSCIGRQILYQLSHQGSPFFSFPCNKFNQDIHRQENADRVVHLYTAMLPSPESEPNNASDNSVGGKSDYHTE